MNETKEHIVLIVDDNLQLLKLGKAIFETGGYQVLCATDGAIALEVLELHDVALIVTDILMPNMDGYSLCYNIRNHDIYRNIPIIIYSATYTSKSDEQLALDIGADRFIRKPAAMNVLLDAARELTTINIERHKNAIASHEISEVMRQYSFRLIEKLEDKNDKLEKAQVSLVKSERYFRALIENIFDAISLHNEKGEIIYQSPATERITGYSLLEAKGMNISQFFHPDDVHETLKRLEKVQNNPGVPVFGVRRMKHKDGHYIWTEGTATNMLNDDSVNAIVANFRDITDRKLAEEKIIHFNRLYAFISQINQTIVHAGDEQMVFDEACRIAIEYGKFKVAIVRKVDHELKTLSIIAQQGLSPEDAISFSDIYYDVNEPYLHMLRTGHPYISNDLEVKPLINDLVHITTSRGWFSSMIVPIKKGEDIYALFNVISGEKNFFDADEVALLEEAAGDISFALGVFEKEKQRTQIENKLKNSEFHLKQAQAMAHVGSWEFDFLKNTFLWSEESCRIYGIDVEDCIQTYDSWISFIHPDDRDHVIKITRQGNRTLTDFSFNHRIIRRDGSERYIFSQAHFELDANGEPSILYGIAHDLTEIKEAENAVLRSEANLRMIMGLLPQCISTRDVHGNYLFVNNSFAGLYQLTPEQIIGKNLVDLMPVQSEGEFFIEQDRELIRSGLKQTIPEYAVTDYSGAKRFFNTTKQPYTIASTNEKAILSITADITEQKQAEAERAKMIADIVQRNKDLEQFSYIVSHNLRSPVANITGLTEILDMPGITAEDRDLLIRELSFSVKKLDDVILDLNYILQIKNSDTRKNETVIFSQLIDDIKLSIGQLIDHDHVQICCDFSAIDEMLTFKPYVYSIFLNLITNSIKYRQPDEIPVINISSVLTDHKIVLVFSDNCLGIDLEKRGGQVFGLYKRFHDHVQGKGMGLFMVKTQVESLGGKISIESEVNKGTIFTLEFETN